MEKTVIFLSLFLVSFTCYSQTYQGVVKDAQNEPIAYGHLDKEGIDVWLGVCVKDSKRGLGLGKEMMSYLLNYAKLKKVPKIRLSVDKENVNAIKMYNKFGFIEQKSSGKVLFMDLDIL